MSAERALNELEQAQAECDALWTENQRLREAIEGVLGLTSSYDAEHFGRKAHLVNNLQAREMLTSALNSTSARSSDGDPR